MTAVSARTRHVFKTLPLLMFAGLAIVLLQSADASATAVRQREFSYENVTLTEDTVWRGRVTVRGSLVVAANATLRIEAGTTIRFGKTPILDQLPNLVVMGRLHCSGTKSNPVVFSSMSDQSWGGIVMLATEKKNLMEHFRIEGALKAVEARFSHLTMRHGLIQRGVHGIVASDAVLHASHVQLNVADRGVQATGSEFEFRHGSIKGGRHGIEAFDSTLDIYYGTISSCLVSGITAKDCRVRVRNTVISDCVAGAMFHGGEGQLLLSQFRQNRDAALYLKSARLKVSRSMFFASRRDAVTVEDGNAVFYGNVFEGNQGYNLVNKGAEDVLAIQNWWGSNSEPAIKSRIQDNKNGQVGIAPWLPQKPAALPF